MPGTASSVGITVHRDFKSCSATRRKSFLLGTIVAVTITIVTISNIRAVCAFRFRPDAAARTPTRATAAFAANMVSSEYSSDIPQNLRGLFGGSGVEGMSNPLMNQQILNLLPPEKKNSLKIPSSNGENVNVAYLGTATYDIPSFREKQTARFRESGCLVTSVDVALGELEPGDDALRGAVRTIAEADILLVSGGNTLFAVDRWTHLGLVPHLRTAMERGCILTGGSAGAICWFDSGHSDSADPETYRDAMMAQYSTADDDGAVADVAANGEDGETSEYDPADAKEWKYLLVPGLAFVPGPFVCCPHHDRVQSNGLLRARDFDAMLLSQARSSQRSVLGLGIDHYAAFVVEEGRYRVYALPEKAGSVRASRNDGGSSDAPVFDVDDDGKPGGTPGVWLKRVIVNNDEVEMDDNLVVEAIVCPPEGKLADLLEYGGHNIAHDHQASVDNGNDDNQKAVETCRKQNPSGICISSVTA